MKSVHLSTVGKSPDPIINGFRAHKVDRQVLLHSIATKDAAEEIRDRIRELVGNDLCELVEVDPFNMSDIVTKVLSKCHDFSGCEFSINISGGTNVMAASALLACFMIGGRAYYMKEQREQESVSLGEMVIEIPIPRVALSEIGRNQKRILHQIAISKGQIQTSRLLVESLNMSAQLVSNHVKQLKEKGLVELTVIGREKNVSLTPAGHLMANIIELPQI